MSNENITRKDFLKKLSFAGVAGLGATSLLAACGGGGKKEASNQTMQSSNQGGSDTASQAASGGEYATAEGPCSDLSGVPEQDQKTRKTLQYTNKSPYPNKHCSNCNFFLKDKYGDKCGGCQLFKGPINPNGHCTSWTAKMS